MEEIKHPNLELLIYCVEQLGPLLDKLVLVGGCATGLLITDSAAPPIRVTVDVDALVEVNSRVEYEHIARNLRDLGFSEDTSEDAPICRWIKDKIILDVIPTNNEVFGFGNPWHLEALRESTKFKLGEGLEVEMLTAPYFLLTKLAAFKGRGEGDYLMSHDLEDLIAVIDGRPELVEELRFASPEVKAALSEEFGQLLSDQSFLDALPGHMPSDGASQARVPELKRKLQLIAEMNI